MWGRRQAAGTKGRARHGRGVAAGLLGFVLLGTAACGSATQPSAADGIAYERFELENGLEVVLHVDPSDPLAAVAMTFHVGSAREVEGRTGFAHLFEHLFFLDSENLGQGGLDRLMTRIGSSTNGSTSRDRTNYFEVVPIDGLEKALWAEADKLGFFINTVSESVVAKEKQVVKNEKRQGVDNQPYGHTNFVIDQALYPEGHPYRWQVIGSLEDLDAATLADAQDFHRRWYGPNNATLVVAGDIDVAQTRRWVEKYFGEIPARAVPERPQVPTVALNDTRHLFHEDRFARLPRLTMAWPTVPIYHPDSYALEVLAALLTSGKSTPFYQVLVEEEELAPNVGAFNRGQELEGRFTLVVSAYPDTDLDSVMAGVEAAFARFDESGVLDSELRRVKAGTETEFYQAQSSALGKAFQLAQYAIFADDPGYGALDLQRTLGVTAEDVARVYDAYIRGRPYIGASFVPAGQASLAVEGAERAEVVEEPIVQGAEAEVDAQRGETRSAEGSFDRSVEPPFGPSPTLRPLDVWERTLTNGVQVFGVEDRETPLVQFELRFRGGSLLENPTRVGAANLLASTLLEGTEQRTPEELEAAIDLLGASLSVRAGPRDFTISGSVLSRNYPELMAIVEEVLLEPRFDPERFALAQQRVAAGLRQQETNPNAVAAWAFNRIAYGGHVLGRNPAGTPEGVSSFTTDDLRTYMSAALIPELGAFHVAGALDAGQATAPLQSLAERWTGGEAPEFPAPPEWSSERAGLYFIDIPGAVQSVVAIGRLALAETDPEYYPAQVMNYRLGGGGFASDLTQELREGEGYTYGIGSGFQGSDLIGPFTIQSSVRSNVTLESLALIKELVETHGDRFDGEDLEVTQGFLLRSNARAFETLGAKLAVVRDVSDYGFEPSYVLDRQETVRGMTVERIKELADRYLDPESMIWLVVGDAATQRGRLDALGLGPSVLLDRRGLPIE